MENLVNDSNTVYYLGFDTCGYFSSPFIFDVRDITDSAGEHLTLGETKELFGWIIEMEQAAFKSMGIDTEIHWYSNVYEQETKLFHIAATDDNAKGQFYYFYTA